MGKILFADMHNNSSLALMPSLFREAGSACFGLSFPHSLLAHSTLLDRHFTFPPGARTGTMRGMVRGLLDALKGGEPDFLLTNDELFIRNLLAARRHLRLQKDRLPPDGARLLALLETSLVTNDDFFTRPGSQDAARTAGFPVLDSFTADSWQAIKAQAPHFGYPFYLKLSFESGGQGVFWLTGPEDLSAVMGKCDQANIHPAPDAPALAQKAAPGQEVSISFSAWRGTLLGYEVYIPLKKAWKNGPTSVLKTTFRPHWAEPLRALVSRLDYTGFGGLDVMETSSSPSSLPTVIEVNLRPTHSLQMGRQTGSPLIPRFAASLRQGSPAVDEGPLHTQNHATLTVFPSELQRDRHSQYLYTCPGNVPWDDPGLLRAVMNQFIAPKRQRRTAPPRSPSANTEPARQESIE
ncbi:hypothetical protein [Sneathiella chinensis]|uniref:ATP-grasp domain-containing protein n=1 Tax=Sneathiella chinensis TaxID=349750 RepID=A0ABQ5U7G7_9PROT|nr:hypothetical protein [Sneathiella chinensis]GLQ06401.1 hypothetical protein GCM10007924_16220 [Sneathiella chinensis]